MKIGEYPFNKPATKEHKWSTTTYKKRPNLCRWATPFNKGAKEHVQYVYLHFVHPQERIPNYTQTQQTSFHFYFIADNYQFSHPNSQRRIPNYTQLKNLSNSQQLCTLFYFYFIRQLSISPATRLKQTY